MKVSMPQPPHRLDRLRAWMDDEKLDCTVVFGTDNVNHLCGYWRYFGGPSALVVGRDGERTLVVMLDEARIASELASADEVIGFGERGFGIDLDPVAGLIGSVAAVPAVRECAADRGLFGAARRRRQVLGCRLGRGRRRRRHPLPPALAQGRGRAREDPCVLRALLDRPSSDRRRRAARAPGDRALHRSPIRRADRFWWPHRVRLRSPLRPERGRGLLPDPGRWTACSRGGRRNRGGRCRSLERLLGRLGRDAHRGFERRGLRCTQ